MDHKQISPRPTNDELWDLASAVSAFICPLGPLAVWVLKFASNRRDLIFSQFGTPVQAYTAEQSPLRLTLLATPSRAAQTPAGTLSINTPLTGAARQLGLRNGDPVRPDTSTCGPAAVWWYRPELASGWRSGCRTAATHWPPSAAGATPCSPRGTRTAWWPAATSC